MWNEGTAFLAESFMRAWARGLDEARKMFTEVLWELEYERQMRVALVTYAPGQCDA